jgi:thiol-disulfide isomerase/thioredoxin
MSLEKFSISEPARDLAVREALDRRRFIQLMTAGSLSVAAGLSSKPAISQTTRGIEGYKAPELVMDYWIDGDGKPGQFSVLESRSKWVFLKCFQNWCPGCHSSGFPTLKAFSDKFIGHPKVAIAGIQTVFEGFTSNTQAAVRELQLRYELPISMGHDPGDSETHKVPSTMRNYRTGGTPWLILINPEGVVVYNGFHVDTRKLIDYVGAQIA